MIRQSIIKSVFVVNMHIQSCVGLKKHFLIIELSEIASHTLLQSVSPQMTGCTVPFAPGNILFCPSETVSVT